MSLDLVEVERVGDLLFGRGLRLRVALWLLDQDEPLHFQGAVAQSLQAPSTEVGKELDRLANLGMLQKLPRVKKNDRKNYIRVNHKLWAAVEGAKAALETADRPA